jgi:hypothetical protein
MCKTNVEIDIYHANICKTWTWKEHDEAMLQDCA